MSRYIDAKQLEKRMCETCETNEHCAKDHCLSKCLIAQVPTADVAPVVRCKNCKYFTNKDHADGRCSLLFVFMKNNDFCSYGKEKEQ